MKYFEVAFAIEGPQSLLQDARDILSAMAGEAGFETFEETMSGLIGYVQQNLFDENQLRQQLSFFPFEDVKITYTINEAEDKDWNAQWEEEGFMPIVIGDRCVIHDGRHLPSSELSFAISIEIDAHLAFGTGTHETTQMMVAVLLDLPLKGKNVLDCGCGTGILGIAAMKAGAAHCLGYDIDEWSVDNTLHNAVINQVDSCYSVLLGDASVLNEVKEQFDVVMANINRNILMNDMPTFRRKMFPGAHLLLSGFYLQDIPLLQEKAIALGFTLEGQTTDGDWACLHFCLS